MQGGDLGVGMEIRKAIIKKGMPELDFVVCKQILRQLSQKKKKKKKKDTPSISKSQREGIT